MTVIHRDQSAWFGILRRPQVDSDRIPEERRDQYVNGMIGRLGLNPALARGARTDAGDVWVVPGNGFICLDVGGMCCNTSEVARSQGLVTWTSAGSGDRTIVHGLVPDGTEEVVLTATDGTTKTVRLRTTCTAQRWKGSSLRCVSPARREPSSSGRGAEWIAARLASGSRTRGGVRNKPGSSIGPVQAVSARKSMADRTLRSPEVISPGNLYCELSPLLPAVARFGVGPCRERLCVDNLDVVIWDKAVTRDVR